MPIYHLIEIKSGKVNDIGASSAEFYNDRLSLTYTINGITKKREKPLYRVVEGTCPKTTAWTHPISLEARLRAMLVARAPGLDKINDDLYLQLLDWIDKAIGAKTAKTLRALASKFRQVKSSLPSVADWLEQGAIECERDADALA